MMRRCCSFLLCVGILSDASASKTDLEAGIKAGYEDQGFVRRKTIEVKGQTVEFLEAGDQGPVVIFCHGAAFSMNTWQFVGVLDALAAQRYRAIAINLPGYGKSSKTVTSGRDGFLADFIDALRLSRTIKIVLVAASMGGSYAIPYLMKYTDRVAGYITAAGVLGRDLSQELSVNTLFIYGDQDPRLQADLTARTRFTQSELRVFKDAPHPCYLRDLDAAREFTNLVLAFVGASSPLSTTVHASW